MIAKFFPFVISAAAAVHLCPPLGSVFPPPSKLSESAVLKRAIENITSSLDEQWSAGSSPYGDVNKGDSLGFQIFSTKEKLWDHYIKGTEMSQEEGVKEIDGESVWRIGSIGKLITVYMFLVEVGDGYWHDPITKYVPELRSLSSTQDDAWTFNWDEVTLGSIAGQISGVAKDILPLDLFLTRFPDDQKFHEFAPPISDSEQPKCNLNSTPPCTREQFFEALGSRHAVFPPNTRPMYGNGHYALLAFALEAISGKSYKDIFESRIVKGLSLPRSYISEPDSSLGVITKNVTYVGWDVDMGLSIPMGGFYFSMDDLSALGRSILNSTLLDKSITRAWLKPTTHTTSMYSSVGMPWEIYRYPIGDREANRLVDVYTKIGDQQGYHAMLVVIPEYEAGFVAVSAGDLAPYWAESLISASLIPALEEAAREEADARFAGTYTTSNSTANTTITITSTPGVPGLGIKEWVYESNDLVAFVGAVAGVNESNFRMYPTNLEGTASDGCVKSQWRTAKPPQPPSDIWSLIPLDCSSWDLIDGPWYRNGNFLLDEMIFTECKNGSVSMEWPALKTKVVKK